MKVKKLFKIRYENWVKQMRLRKKDVDYTNYSDYCEFRADTEVIPVKSELIINDMPAVRSKK